MSKTEIIASLPLLVLASASLVVMLGIAVRRHHPTALGLTLAGLVLTMLTVPLAAAVAPRAVTPLLVIDTYALFYIGLIAAAGVVVALLSYIYLARRPAPPEEYYLLLLLATLGAATLVAARHFASFFLGLELLSVALFGLIAYAHRSAWGLEAAVKYLILAGISSAFMLMGMAFIYVEVGTMEFARMAALWPTGANPILLTGLGLIITGVGFKLSVVPFHMWTPDVFEGAPAPIAGLLASVSKGAVFALLLRYFADAQLYRFGSLVLVLSLVAIASMLVGNLLALLQDNVKRLLAYSSIAHLGYLLVALLVGGALGIEAATYYLVAYFVTILAAFGVVGILSANSGERDAADIESYRGLFWRRPWLAGIFSGSLLSLAGIPLTIGFIGKFYLFAAGVAGTLWAPVIALIVGSAIGLFYYVRLLTFLFTITLAERAPTHPAPDWSAGIAMGVLALLLIGLGLFPAPLMQLIHLATPRLG
jgi:NADH-quinone oxidoreductase subunit N